MFMGNRSLGTKCVHGKGYVDSSTGAFIVPIYQTAIFLHPDGSPLSPRGRPLKYSREDNPTLLEVESKIALLEGGEDGLVFSSGMAAASSMFLWRLRAGGEIVVPLDLYGVTVYFLKQLEKFGVKVKIADPGTDNLVRAITSETSLVFLESLSNPLVLLYDVEEVAEAAREAGALLAVDNTFATPVNFRPLEHGADVVVHSATKYLNGHNDVIAGAIVGRGKEVNEIWEWRRYLGGCLDPHSAFLLDRGLKTLEVRVRRQNESASKLASFLASLDKIRKVYYPGLDTHPHHHLAKRYLRGYGGIISFELDCDLKSTLGFMKDLKVIRRAPSLGGTESLVMHPATSSHKDLTPEERQKLGITDSLVRLSVGLEDVEDIEEDIAQAISKI